MNLIGESNKPQEGAKSLLDKYSAEKIKQFIKHMTDRDHPKELAIRALESEMVKGPEDFDAGKTCPSTFIQLPNVLKFI